jgi:hypothetical protein
MSELGEAVGIALTKDIVTECPFQHDDQQYNETNDLSNNSRLLGSAAELGIKADVSITVELRGSKKTMDLAFQAHHLIPGTSIKNATALRSWMEKGKTVKGDIGYLQNDRENGVWLPALHRFEGWGALTNAGGYEIQFAYAYAAMKASNMVQFHMGDGAHGDYNAFVRRTLEKFRVKMLELRSECEKCDKAAKKPYKPPYKLVGMLYQLAGRMKRFVTGPTSKWVPPLCTSDFAVLVGAGYTPDKIARL